MDGFQGYNEKNIYYIQKLDSSSALGVHTSREWKHPFLPVCEVN